MQKKRKEREQTKEWDKANKVHDNYTTAPNRSLLKGSYPGASAQCH